MTNEEYSIQVQALDSGKYKSSDLSNEFKYLKTPEKLETPQVRVVDNFLLWDIVDGARAYLVKEGDVSFETADTYFNVNRFLHFRQGMSYSIEVIALAEPNQNIDSDSCDINYGLFEKLVLDLNESILSWNEIPNTEYYRVAVEGNHVEVTDTSVDLDEYFPDLIKGNTYQVTVIPGNDEGGFYSTHSEEKILYKKPLDKIKAPSVVDIEGTTLHWAEVELASSYKVVVGDYKEIVQELSFDLETVAGLVGGTVVEVSVVALPEDPNLHALSLPKKVEYTVPFPRLETPVLQIDGSMIYWDEVPDATGYAIHIWNIICSTKNTFFDLSTHEDLEPGTYDVFIYAIADSSKNSNSLNSNIEKYTKEPIE